MSYKSEICKWVKMNIVTYFPVFKYRSETKRNFLLYLRLSVANIQFSSGNYITNSIFLTLNRTYLFVLRWTVTSKDINGILFHTCHWSYLIGVLITFRFGQVEYKYFKTYFQLKSKANEWSCVYVNTLSLRNHEVVFTKTDHHIHCNNDDRGN